MGNPGKIIIVKTLLQIVVQYGLREMEETQIALNSVFVPRKISFPQNKRDYIG